MTITSKQKLPVPTVTLVHGENQDGVWKGLFVNGVLADQGHSVTAWKLLEALSKTGVIVYEELEASVETLEQFGSFSESLDQNRKDGIIQ